MGHSEESRFETSAIPRNGFSKVRSVCGMTAARAFGTARRPGPVRDVFPCIGIALWAAAARSGALLRADGAHAARPGAMRCVLRLAAVAAAPPAGVHCVSPSHAERLAACATRARAERGGGAQSRRRVSSDGGQCAAQRVLGRSAPLSRLLLSLFWARLWSVLPPGVSPSSPGLAFRVPLLVHRTWQKNRFLMIGSLCVALWCGVRVVFCVAVRAVVCHSPSPTRVRSLSARHTS